MKSVSVAFLLIGLSVFGARDAHSSRVPPRPEALRRIEADAIALVLITDLQVAGTAWRATVAYRGTLLGDVPQREFSLDNGPAGGVVISSGQSWPPKIGRYGVLYLRRTVHGLRADKVYPYWWARASRDPRLARLDRLLPLGAARETTSEEARLLDLAEPRVELPPGISDLSRHTRVYARTSATTVTGLLLRSQTPRRLIVDGTEELPTEESCGCQLARVAVDLTDLWDAGLLPPFKP